ncbi:MAG TPA: restriction endonuclease subunit R [Verrucomicrobiales bacterium]|nr:restriction endonuclease subunit R [Verrucomicrobiales bacterium]
MKFNEDSRVKIPAILHLTRLGYTYLSLKGLDWDESSNIVPSLFRASVAALNPTASPVEIEAALGQLDLVLDNEDLGKQFYEKITQTSGLKIIDFENLERNTYHVVTEFTCKKDDEEFRPDITLLINGLPLVFIEVKKPNNHDGMLAERHRIVTRFKNPKFKRFINITQLMVFSNNMEYDDGSPEPLEGAFYASASYGEPVFNYFREEEVLNLGQLLQPFDQQTEDFVLADTNLTSIKHSPEFATNKNPDTPTNRLSTSLFSRARLAFMLRFGIAYVKTETRLEKHVMRYPQVFAAKAIEKKLDAGIRKGIIWHTQGSGKTALAFYCVHFLTDYFQKQGVIPKFYFIVDRIDLLEQASREFRSRGLHVHTINSRDEFAADIKSNVAVHNNAGLPEITVVNIQRFKDDSDVVKNTDYALGLQRVYFLDEVHRSYNPEGSFLANLNQSDSQAIKIGLTGTPLLNASLAGSKDDDGNATPRVAYNSKLIFGDYIHKYYYNRSIADGYTLRLIREEIETKYKMQLKETLEQIKLLKDMKNRTLVYSHEKFVEPMLDYIVEDFENSRVMKNDFTTGAMVICDSSEQAKEMARLFEKKYAAAAGASPAPVAASASSWSVPHGLAHAATAAETHGLYVVPRRTVATAALILHDVGTKSERKEQVEAFKEGKIDLLFVFNMLLTGFDAARLKKLYLGRIIKAHNLLQALTRVNRPYSGYRYGSVVDFVNIEAEFAKTNKDYFDELQSELGDELQSYSDLFKTEAEITADIEAIKDALFHFNTENAEVFSQQVTQITDRAEMRKIVKALNDAKSLYNLIRLAGQYELLAKLDFRKITQLSTEANNHLTLLNQREALEHADEGVNILNIALEDVLFTFRKVSQAEMVIADELREQLRRTREGLGGNFDQGDPAFVTLKEELERLFKKKNLSEITQTEMVENIKTLKDIQARARELERRNQLIRAKYANDEKYARLHKRLLEKGEPTKSERKLFEALSAFKAEADARISQNAQILNNEAFAKAEMTRLIIEQIKNKHQLPLTAENTLFINNLVMKEYLAEFHGHQAA